MKHTFPVTVILVLMFLGAQYFGIIVLSAYIDQQASKEAGKVMWKQLPEVAGYRPERPPEDANSYLWIIGAILVGTLLILLIIKLRMVFVWKGWFFITVLWCMYNSFAALFPALWSGLIAFLLSIWKIFKPNMIIHNLTELFIYAGLAAIFVPILNMTAIWILLIIISLYDMYAVWQSKHMIKMAKFQTQSGVFAGLLIPYKGKIDFSKAEHKMETKHAKHESHAAVLGGGDIGFPLIFTGVIMKTFSIGQALIIPVFTGLALLTLLLLSRKNRFYPAMPFMTAGCLLGYVVINLV